MTGCSSRPFFVNNLVHATCAAPLTGRLGNVHIVVHVHARFASFLVILQAQTCTKEQLDNKGFVQLLFLGVSFVACPVRQHLRC